MNLRFAGACIFLLVLGAAPAPLPQANADQEKTRAIMQSIFAAITQALKPSFNGTEFSESKQRAAVEGSLKALKANASLLEKHAGSHDRAFEFVAKSLGRDAKTLLNYYQKGRYDEARFILHNMTDNCIACHSSFAETRSNPKAAEFFAAVDVTNLVPGERAYLQVVSRDFDAALTSYESMLGDRDLSPTLVVTLGSFTDYLKIAIGVKHDFKRPQPLMLKIRGRPSTPLHVRMQLDRWIAALQKLDAAQVFEQKNGLQTGRDLMFEGRSLMEFPRDRDGLVQYVTANALLSRYVHTHPDRGQEVAEAYYMLGISESLLEHSMWLMRSEFYFESAIRLAPASPFATKAYAMLEESVTADNSGSAGTNVPEELTELLVELRSIIEQAQGRRIDQF